jgi:hypothetical protein
VARIRNKLKSLAFSALAEVRRLRKAVTVQAHDREHQVTIVVQPVGTQAGQVGPPPGVPGRFLSDSEAAVVNALGAAAGARLNGKQLAARCSREYDTKFKHLLMNLEDREVIDHDPGDGYAIKAAKKETAGAAG